MNIHERKALDTVMLEFLNSMLSIYQFEDDVNRDLCMDAIMMWLFENFGKGEVLEYTAISMDASEGIDHKIAAEHLRNAIEAIPEESEFNLFGENLSDSLKLAFIEVWKVNQENRAAALELIQEFVRSASSVGEREVANDMLQILIAQQYEIEDDLEMLKKKYFGEQRSKIRHLNS